MSNGNDTDNDRGSGGEPATEVLLAKEPATDSSAIKVLTSRNGAIWLTGAMVIAIRMRMYEIGFRIVTPKSSARYRLQYVCTSPRRFQTKGVNNRAWIGLASRSKRIGET